MSPSGPRLWIRLVAACLLCLTVIAGLVLLVQHLRGG